VSDAVRAYLSLGSNLGDRLQSLAGAVRSLREKVRVVATSPVYETEALGPDGEPVDQPAFLNCVLAVDTGMTAPELHAVTRDVERAYGRATGERWQPRPIDIDILLRGDTAIATPGLTIPHPRLAERAFVLRPLFDLDPDLLVDGVRSVADLLPRVAGQGIRLHTSAAAFARLIDG
jgi:2-amino-4-hydroxy-6-hydroxymethyldihydropteridine diphosphokinase